MFLKDKHKMCIDLRRVRFLNLTIRSCITTTAPWL